MMNSKLFVAVALVFAGAACSKPPAAPTSAQSQPATQAAQSPAANPNSAVPPRLLNGVKASFPEELWNKPGTVTVAAVVGVDGKIGETKVVSSPHPELNDLATDSVKKWTFEPAKKDGKPVPFTITVNVNFAPPAKTSTSAQKPQK